MQYFVAFSSRLEADSDVISGSVVGPIVPDKGVKFRHPRLNPYPEIRPKADRCIIFDRFSNFNKCQSEPAGDFICDVAVD